MESELSFADKSLKGRRKWYLLTVIKCGISGALIYLILRNINLKDIFITMISANKSILIAALLLNYLGVLISTNRWRILLGVLGVNVSIIFLIKSYMVGFFVNNFTPSIIGGDAVRAYDSWRVGKSKTGAVTVIFIERLLGMLALLLLSVCSFLGWSEMRYNFPMIYMILIIVTFFVFLVVWTIFFPYRRVSTLISKIRVPFSQKLQNILEKFSNTFLTFQGRKKTLAKTMGLSLLLQTNVIIHYYLISKAINFEIPLYVFFAIVPVSLIIMMIPISINAIGIRESAFAFFLASFGINQFESVAFAWLTYGFVILNGILGGVVFAFRKS